MRLLQIFTALFAIIGVLYFSQFLPDAHNLEPLCPPRLIAYSNLVASPPKTINLLNNNELIVTQGFSVSVNAPQTIPLDTLLRPQLLKCSNASGFIGSASTSHVLKDSAGLAVQPRRVLFIGDSELETLRFPLYAYLKANNMELSASVIWYGSATKHWAQSDSLSQCIKAYKPDFVMIALGLNEVSVTDIATRVQYVQSIKQKLDQLGLKYFWIGPACWKKDNGIVSAISGVFKQYFFSSDRLVLERGRDGRHPSSEAAWNWMQSVMSYLNAQHVLSLRSPELSRVDLGSPKTIIWPVPKW